MSRTHSIVTGATLTVAALILVVHMHPASAQSSKTAFASLGPVGVAQYELATLGFFNASRSEVRVRLALYSRATGGRIAVVDASVPPGSQAFLDSPIIGFEGDAIAGTVSVVSATGSAGGSVGSISLQVMDTQTGKYVCCHVAGDIDFD